MIISVLQMIPKTYSGYGFSFPWPLFSGQQGRNGYDVFPERYALGAKSELRIQNIGRSFRVLS